MYHLKLIKALSYTGVVNATVKKPDVYVDDKATADAAVATGYFELLGKAKEQEQDPEPEVEEKAEEKEPLGYGGKPLSEMNKSELETFATYKDVDIKGAKTRAQIIAKLEAALDPAELEGDINYGSPTMTELQKA